MKLWNNSLGFNLFNRW